MFQVPQMFHRYVATVSYGCCKSRLGRCMCCNGWTVCCKFLFLMFHLFFLDVCHKCGYLDVAYVSHICYKGFIWMLLMFYNGFEVFLQVFHMHISSVSSDFKRIVQMFAPRCFKSRLSVASSSSPSATLPRCLLLLPALAGHLNQRHERAPPPPPRPRRAKRSAGAGVRTWASVQTSQARAFGHGHPSRRPSVSIVEPCMDSRPAYFDLTDRGTAAQ
jgi:hypothetical protein